MTMTYKLLIVDDSKLARMAVVKALNSCYPDWQRVEAGSAADALRAMEAEAPHVAIVDFNMPNRDGLHLAAELRRLNPKMPIGIISANHQQSVVDRANVLGATFLPKPLAEKVLLEFLTKAAHDLQGSSP
jgi:DNA-binding NarL/FixJ family response regulator